jgi:phosphotriesterase-related protein
MSKITTRTTYLTMSVLLLVTVCTAVVGKTIYVDDDATGANDGTSWANAYVYLQDALADAETAEMPVEIRVAQGIYKPDQGVNQTPGDRKATFQLMNNVVLKGGFAGVGVEPDIRDIELYETILSGDLEGNDVDVNDLWELRFEPTKTENSFHVVTGSETDKTAVLQGFVVTGSYAHCPDWGPSCLDEQNGGGILIEAGGPTLIDCTFEKNSAYFLGGASYIEDGTPTLHGCTFSLNEAGAGGAIASIMSSSYFSECTFSKNTAHGIAVSFSGTTGTYGGAIRTEDSNDLLIGCVFIANVAGPGDFRMGGAIGAYRCFGTAKITVANSLFCGNQANYGGGIDSADVHMMLANCTFADNQATHGRAMCCWQGDEEQTDLLFTNCILYNGENEISNNDNSNVTITYSNIKGGWPGEGNIDVDPCFVKSGHWTDRNDPNVVVSYDPSAVWVDGDYHLKSQYGRWGPVSESWVMDDVTSPCIDAGDPNSSVGDEPEPNGGRINMGAYGGTAEASKSDYTWWFATTDGPVAAEGLGIILPHEHIFTDLRGPTSRTYGQANAADVVRVMAPLLEAARQKGVGLLIECSSIGVGRNVSIISQVAQESGLPVVVPTGVYGRANFAPVEHRNMSEDELTELFIKEIREGIEGTGIKAGFIKIATGNSTITALEEKFLRAAGRAARETGAAVASHTPRGSNATRQADILESISPAIRFIWVHAQNESNRSLHRQLAARGVFIELDSLGWNPGQDSTFIAIIKELLAAGYGEQILLSHDAGWYQPGEQNGGTQKPYTYLVETFIPKLRNAGVDEEAIRMITETNPIRAFGFKQQ